MNEVIVTRAPRLKLVKRLDYLIAENVSKYAIEADGTTTVVGPDEKSFYLEPRRMHGHLWESYDFVFPMDSFEDVAKWVANGRKLEDLQGDVSAEKEQLVSMGLGDYFTHNGDVYMIMNFGLGSGCTTTVEAWGFNKRTCVEFNVDMLVWPVRLDLGDTITIKGGENG